MMNQCLGLSPNDCQRHIFYVQLPPSPLFWKSMEVHNVPEASDTNTFAEKGKSETFTEYHGISCLGGRK